MAWFSPDGNAKYTQGPDCDTGSNCCCGKCSFVTLATDCNNTVCCKCVPKYLCAVFYPAEESEDCLSSAVEMTFGGTWVGNLPGIDPANISNQIEVHLVKDESYQRCFYRVIIPAREIDDLYLIEGGKRECSIYPSFRLTCRDPYFEYPDFELNGCVGTLVIQRKELAKVPFHAEVETDSTITSEEMSKPECGTCSTWCTHLCLEWSTGGEPQKASFGISQDESVVRWTHRMSDGSYASITTQEIEGQCHLVIDHDGLGGFQPIPIPYQMCNLGMVIEADGEGEWVGKSVSISCNRCSCWDYICETCRCVCKTFCVVSVDGPESTDITYYELEWDDRLLRWGTAEKWVGIRANQTTGKCEFVISGWNDGIYPLFDPESTTIEIEECGKDMSYYVTIDPEKAFETGVFKFEYGACKTCLPDCFRVPCQDCCTACDTVALPEILYVDLFGGFTAGGEDPGEAAANCLTVTDIPLVHTAPLFAELHRWSGSVVVDCGCPLDPFTPDPSPNATKIDLVIICLGGNQFQLSLSMKGRTLPTTGGGSADSTNPFETITFSCNPFTWTGRFLLNPGFDANADNCCCPLASSFEFAVSE